ncbi:VirK domain-containing protein [Pseudomonas putida]|nr:VirK domain-containing protein [Pseudomonas putida]
MMLGTIVKSVFTLQPGYSLRALNNKYKLTLQIARQWPELNAFLQRMTAALGQQGLQRLGVDCIGVVQWPYLSKCWEAPQRLEVLASHFEVLAGQFPALLLLGRDESLTLCELSGYSPGCRLVLDRPIWFKREGELVLNLFQTDLRVASLAFSLCRSQGELCLFIGAVQGIHKGIDSETSLAIYRDLTKDFEGLRPRSLLLEALKCLARTLGVAHLYAVTDACRHHRHAYFGNHKGQDLAANYDVIWLEHGAIASNHADFLALPLAAAQRAEQDIPAKKRAMYRRRQALLDHVFARLQAALPGSGHNLGLQEEQGDAADEPASAARRPPVVGNLE